ncbi:hypothetical protein AZF37_06300 [endosymbiont 'TC1' of Trimyema compressum]|uniref:hypothetical protein n=1 Tax=endosymbiont 'TC1' of Trimyema compressum TaxID=243899 RepID=UPI0007F08275|nr:hypothetical protein [endosymbiont 'TC1' of Trimyema compressum]AMP20834.1 hypothetical protein AZF37_06300 [endosymbiont 'TC1' of Trimyema compressum]
MDTQVVLGIGSFLAFIMAAILIILALVKGRKSMRTYYRLSIAGLTTLLIGEILQIVNDYVFLSGMISMFNVLFLVLTIVLMIIIINRYRKL